MIEHFPKRNVGDGSRSRESLREHLEQQFVAYHAGRRKARRAAGVGAIAALAGLLCIGIIGTAFHGLPQVASSPRSGSLVDPRPFGDPTVPSDQSNTANLQREYASIQVTDISDDELHSLLRSSEAHWFVAEIDGTPTAFPLN